MGRTERQRRVIQMIVDKAKKAGLSTIFDIMDQVFPMVKTSVSKTEILKLIPAMIGYCIDETTGFPQDYKFATVKGSVIVPTTLDSNVLKLHQFLYGNTNYTPTQDVLNKSAQIAAIVGGGQVQDTAPAVTDAPNTTTDNSYTWEGSTDTSADYSYDDTDYSDNTDYTDYGNDTSDDTDYSGGGDDSNTDYSGGGDDSGNDDSGAGHYTSKKFVVIHPEEQPRTYKTEISHLTIELPDNPMRYTAVPNAEKGEGVWAASGVNAAQVGMTATETITSNPRVLGADPLVLYQPAEDGKEEVPGGIGEEDLVYIVLPYIKSAREGVKRLGSLLEQYGTYEMNGIAFQDHDEIWWLETIGGHHWMAVKVPDDHYVAMPNQLGIDHFDLEDALGEQKEYMCSADLKEFIETYHLDLSMDGNFNPRDAFGSHDDSDHVYNTPRAWFMERYLNPHTKKWDGPYADYTPVSDDIPWMMVPEKKITVEDVKYVLSSHYQGTPYDPYAAYGDKSWKGAYRSIGVNRTDFLSVIQMRPDHKGDNGILQ